MKTAKELCEEKDQQELKYIIARVADSGLKSTFGIYANTYYLGASKVIKDIQEIELIERNKEKLQELGYTVKEVPQQSYEVNKVRKLKEVLPGGKFLWFKLNDKHVYEEDMVQTIIETFMAYEVSACCGEEK